MPDQPEEICPDCEGDGSLDDGSICDWCNGTGFINATEEVHEGEKE